MPLITSPRIVMTDICNFQVGVFPGLTLVPAAVHPVSCCKETSTLRVRVRSLSLSSSKAQADETGSCENILCPVGRSRKKNSQQHHASCREMSPSFVQRVCCFECTPSACVTVDGTDSRTAVPLHPDLHGKGQLL